MIDISQRFTGKKLRTFAGDIRDLSRQIGFKVSSRGWAYILEQQRYINKDQFDKAQELINKCRREGLLPIDFVAEESARDFQGIVHPNTDTPEEHTRSWLEAALNAAGYWNVDAWEDEEYYIQVLVEKVDLVTLFEPVTREYHIPIANARGWSSMLQRAQYAKRFQEAEDRGLKCVLLYCGDHDPDGLRISDTILKGLFDLSNVSWSDGSYGYNPENLIVDRFGLNYDFIQANKLTWIDNLITGSGKEIAVIENGQIRPGRHRNSKGEWVDHPNFNLRYMQDYLAKVGVRKCEANAIVTAPQAARQLVREAIEKWLGPGFKGRMAAKLEPVSEAIDEFYERTGIKKAINDAFDELDGY